jgi:transcriptional regulator with PAS, ATPase and Fis domain
LSKGLIDVIHIGLDIQEDMVGANEGLLKSTEKETIQRVISEVGGNRRKAAEILGISLRTLQYRIKEYGLN